MNYRVLVVAGLLAAVVGSAWMLLPETKMARVGEPAQVFTLPDMQDVVQSLPKGEVILLNFWASWCSPCRQEIPSMGELYQRYGDKGLKVVAVSVDHQREMLESFVREHKIEFQVLQDPDRKISHDYGVFRYPESFLIDRQGVVRKHYIGAENWMSPNVLATIEQLMKEPGNGAEGVAIDGRGAGSS